MSQYDFGDLESPLSGTTFFNTHLEPWRNALHSQHSGSSRPPYAVAGTLWIDNTTNPWILKVFDGSNDIGVGLIDTVANTFTPVSTIAAADVEVDDAGFAVLTAVDAQDAFDQIDALFAGLGTAASVDVGTAIGDIPQLVNVGGSAGLPAVNGGNLTGVVASLPQIASKTSNYTTTNADKYVPCDGTSAAFTTTLHTAVGNAGSMITIEKTDSTLNQITIDANGSQTINGALTIKLCTQYEKVTLLSDGANWKILTRTGTITPWIAYTPTLTGFGTGSGISWFSRRNGDCLELRGVFTSGTSTGTEARVSLGFNGVNTPAGLTADTTKIPALRVAGVGSFSYSTASVINALIENAVAYLTLGYPSASSSGKTKQLGNVLLNSGQGVDFGVISVPIQGWEC